VGAAAAYPKYVLPRATPTQNVACGAPATLGTSCGTTAGLPAATLFYWMVGSTYAATGLTPTVTPTAPSTSYTLMALVPGLGTLNLGTTILTLNGQQPCPTGCQAGSYYSNSNDYSNPYGPDYELGDATNTHSVPQIQGPVTFDGVYHVVGPVEFVGDEIILNPGTIFYVDGGPGDRPVVSQGNPCYEAELGNGHHYLQLFVGQDAILTLQGATLTADCQDMWGGVELVDNGRLVTQYDNGPSTISEARVGVLAGTACRSTQATYDLTDTRFYNNTYGVAVWGNDPGVTSSGRIEYCVFSSDYTQRLAPDNLNNYGVGDYGRAGLVLRGDGHTDSRYHDNHFSELYAGAELAGEGVLFEANTLENCYGSAIRVGAPDVTQPIGRLRVVNNTVNVPDNPLPGGQVPPDAEVKGIELLDMPQGPTWSELSIEENIVTGASYYNPQKPLIGLDGYLCFQGTFIKGANVFHTLDRGVRLLDASAQLGVGQVVANNYFGDCDKAVYLHGANSAGPFAPTVTCNSFANADYGIYIENGADVGDLADYSGSALEPCSNAFAVNVYSVENQGLNNISYYYDSAWPEDVSQFSPGVTAMPVAGATKCIDRSYAPYGLQRSSTGLVSVTTLAAWKNQLLAAQGPPQELRRVERQLLTYYARNEQWAALDSFVTALPQLNPAAFERLSLALLHAYRAADHPADVQRVRTALLAWRGSSPDLQQRVAYFDVTGHLGQLAPGQRPTPADSATLAAVAGSTAGFAPVACATLRYYYPQVACAAPPLLPRPAARPAGSSMLATARPAAAKTIQLRALPNPASETVRLEVTGAVPGDSRVELLELATGRSVLSQALPADGRALLLDVRPLAPGVYAARLLGGPQLLGTTKVVVVR